MFIALAISGWEFREATREVQVAEDGGHEGVPV